MGFKYLAAVSAAICLLSPNFSYSLGLITNQDPQILMVGGGGALIYLTQKETRLLNEKLNGEIGNIEREILRGEGNVKDLLSRAKTVEAGGFSVAERTLYTGRYMDAREYNMYAGEPVQMGDNRFRLQPNGAKELASAIQQEAQNRHGDVTLIVDRVHGTSDSSIRMANSTTISGSPEQVTKQLVELSKAQSPTSAPDSIVRVRLSFQEPVAPNPTLAAQLRGESAEAEARVKGLKAASEQKVAGIKEKYATDFKKLKMKFRGGVSLIGAAILIGFVRDSFAQGMVTLSTACGDEDALKTQAVGWSLQTGMTVDEAYSRAQKLCAESMK